MQSLNLMVLPIARRLGALALLKSLVFWALLSSLSQTSWASPATGPFEFTTRYQAQWSGYGVPITVNGERRLKKTADNQWHFEFNASALAANFKETLSFHWRQDSLVPIEYRYKQGGLLPKKKQHIAFDWPALQAQDKEADFTYDIQPNTLDPLGYQLQLQLDLIHGKAELVYPLINRKKHKRYEFYRAGEEILETPLGPLKAVRVEQVHNPKKKRQTHIWFAKDLRYLMIRFKQTDKNKRYEINIAGASIEGKAIKAAD